MIISTTMFWDFIYYATVYGIILPIALIQLKRTLLQIWVIRFYRSQYGSDGNWIECPGNIMGFGSLVPFIMTNIELWRTGSNKNPITLLVEKHCPMTPCNFLLASAVDPGAIICDVRVVEAMYTTKNKYFDKHPITADFTQVLMGSSILFSKTTHEWKTSRKAMSPAFYKGKLIQMIEIAKLSMRTTLSKLRTLAKAGPKTTIDLIAEISMMQVRILLQCALGEDISDQEVDYWVSGKLEKRCISYALR